MTPERRQQLEDQLSAYLDDELSEAERAEVETLLGEDTAARRLLAELEATATGLRGLPRAKASADLMNDLRTRMERQALLGTPGTSEGTREAPVPALARWLAAAAVVAVAFVGGYWLWTFREQPPAPSVSRPLTMVDRSESSRYVRHEQKGIRVLDEVGTAQTAREEKADHEEAAAPEQSVRMGVELVPSESSITAKERFAGRQQATSGGGSPSQPEASAGAYTVRIKSRGFETERMTTTMTTHGAGLSAPQAVPASPLALIAKAKEKVQEEYGEKASVTVSTEMDNEDQQSRFQTQAKGFEGGYGGVSYASRSGSEITEKPVGEIGDKLAAITDGDNSALGQPLTRSNVEMKNGIPNMFFWSCDNSLLREDGQWGFFGGFWPIALTDQYRSAETSKLDMAPQLFGTYAYGRTAGTGGITTVDRFHQQSAKRTALFRGCRTGISPSSRPCTSRPATAPSSTTRPCTTVPAADGLP